VRSFVHRTIVLALVTTLIAGCDGGGTSTSPVPRSGSPSQSQAVGRGTLTIVFPANFHRATRAASTTRAAAAVRKPVYVNPTNTNILDIYVDGTLQTNLDGNTPNDSATISNTDSSGTQTLNIPLYSTATNDIAVVEYDADKANVLAVGENPATPQFSPGTSPQISVSLLMNVQGIAIASSSSGGSASQLSPNGNNEFDICPSNTLSNTFFLFATDADDGFVATYRTTRPPSCSRTRRAIRASQTSACYRILLEWSTPQIASRLSTRVASISARASSQSPASRRRIRGGADDSRPRRRRAPRALR
jgi:hypothetical protein